MIKGSDLIDCLSEHQALTAFQHAGGRSDVVGP